MQREISDKNTLGDTLSPINDARHSTAIDRYVADLAKYIPGLMDLAI